MTRASKFVLIGIVVVLVGGVGIWLLINGFPRTVTPGCTIAAPSNSNGATTTDNGSSVYPLTQEQADNAATIAAVGVKLGLPDHAVTVALATAMQESKLVNLLGGDRDSAGLFQQRPSQGWGTYEQVTDPVYASTAFYQHLQKVSDWQNLPVTEAAQAVQHSAAPDGYASWEQEATATAIAFTGESPAALSCHDIAVGAPRADLVSTASNELGTSTLTGRHDTASGWTIATWLVAHCVRLGIDQVTFDGRTWTASSGSWSQAGAGDGMLSLHQVPKSAGTSGPAS